MICFSSFVVLIIEMELETFKNNRTTSPAEDVEFLPKTG